MGDKKYQLKNGRCFADYVVAAGFGLGYCVGNAAQHLYKAGLAKTDEEHEKCMQGCTWYINHAAKTTHLHREEIMEMVMKITEAIEKDQLQAGETSNAE